ncbi:2,5-diketo-D-gluconic acid reductase A [compost metagenome]
MEATPTLILNDGKRMPQLGLGVWQVSDEEAVDVVRDALNAGYRAVDTAAIYGNEAGVGQAIRESGLPRAEVFVTTKIWNTDQGYDQALRAMETSLKRLGMDYVDLYLIHWPTPSQDRYLDTWRALERLRAEGMARSIGVSNFKIPHLERLLAASEVVPAVNQIELHPYLQQPEMRAFHAAHGIATESWSPLAKGQIFGDPVIGELAAKYGKSPAQIVIRWNLDSGQIVIPKSVTPSRLRENLAVMDFRLEPDDLARLTTLDQSRRVGPDPDTFS